MNLIPAFLSEYANLLLALITALYAFLTWRILRETRRAREHQLDALVTAAPVPWGPVCAQLRLENAGPAPAIDVTVGLHLEPPLDTSSRQWNHPILAPGQVENFILPHSPGQSSIPELRALAEKHDTLVVDLAWRTISGRQRRLTSSFKLGGLVDGWYAGGHLISPEALPEQMEKLNKTLEEIDGRLEKIARAIH
jgi:hypothetical protein